MCIIHFKWFMQVDILCVSEKLIDAFILDKVEMEILAVQRDINLKAHQGAPNLWKLVDPEMYIYICTAQQP